MSAQAKPVMIHTTHFGLIELNEQKVINLLAPLPPFVGLRYVLLSNSEEEPFSWLQSVDEPALALVVAPYELLAGEPPTLSKAQQGELGLGPDDEPDVYVIISLGENSKQTTANLLAPLYVCSATRRGRQVIREGDLALARVPLV